MVGEEECNGELGFEEEAGTTEVFDDGDEDEGESPKTFSDISIIHGIHTLSLIRSRRCY